mgnify:CR=1 FL=1
MRRFVTLFLFAFLVLASARGWAVEADPISPGSWTMIILPDTQYYAESFPHIFHAQTEWIAAHKDWSPGGFRVSSISVPMRGAGNREFEPVIFVSTLPPLYLQRAAINGMSARKTLADDVQ